MTSMNRQCVNFIVSKRRNDRIYVDGSIRWAVQQMERRAGCMRQSNFKYMIIRI